MNQNLNFPLEMNTEEELEDLLSQPSPELVDMFKTLEGDVMFLGVGGKMGPTLARMAQRASEQSGTTRRVFGVSRFSDSDLQMNLLNQGIETISCDLLNQESLNHLPSVPNIVFMAAQKFGSTGSEWMTWAMNTFLPGLVAERFRDSRLVVFSTGNVYPLVPPSSGGSREDDAVGPIGEYAQSCLGRERMFEYGSRKYQTPCSIIRLNYAVELRYGVLVDIARKVLHEEPIDLTMGYVNVIWQGDASDYTLRALGACSSPPEIINVTGQEILTVRMLAQGFGSRFGKEPRFTGDEAETALLNNASKCFERFGFPATPVSKMMDWIAHWLQKGGRIYNKPTKYEVRTGKF